MPSPLMRVLLCCCLLGASIFQTSRSNGKPSLQTPERIVEGTSILSKRDPAMRITLPSTVRYVGADRWNLYDVADCELHLFVEADAQKRIKALYWIQFEQYLPSRPELHHAYKDQQQLVGGLPTYVRARFGATGEPDRPGSDTEHVHKLLTASGFMQPADMMNVRLVRLLDPAKRKELMVIYAEDLAPQGVTSAELMTGGSAADRWPKLQASLMARAVSKIRFHPVSPGDTGAPSAVNEGKSPEPA